MNFENDFFIERLDHRKIEVFGLFCLIFDVNPVFFGA